MPMLLCSIRTNWVAVSRAQLLMRSGQLRNMSPSQNTYQRASFSIFIPRSDIVQQADAGLLCLAAFRRLVSDASDHHLLRFYLRLDKFYQVLTLFFRIVPESTTVGNLEMGFMVPVRIID